MAEGAGPFSVFTSPGFGLGGLTFAAEPRRDLWAFVPQIEILEEKNRGHLQPGALSPAWATAPLWIH